jgi:hypothetical protein
MSIMATLKKPTPERGTSRGPQPAKKRAAAVSHPGRTARVLGPLRTRGTSVCSVVMRAGGTWLLHPRPNRGRWRASPVCTRGGGVPHPPGGEEAATGRADVCGAGTGALPDRVSLLGGDTTRPGCGREGGGGGGATCLVGMTGTGGRGTRRDGPQRPHTPAPGGCLPRGAFARQATPGLWQGPCEAERSRIMTLESGGRCKAPAPFGRGKDCKVLPILTVLFSDCSQYGSAV